MAVSPLLWRLPFCGLASEVARAAAASSNATLTTRDGGRLTDSLPALPTVRLLPGDAEVEVEVEVEVELGVVAVVQVVAVAAVELSAAWLGVALSCVRLVRSVRSVSSSSAAWMSSCSCAMRLRTRSPPSGSFDSRLPADRACQRRNSATRAAADEGDEEEVERVDERTAAGRISVKQQQ